MKTETTLEPIGSKYDWKKEFLIIMLLAAAIIVIAWIWQGVF